MERTQGCSEWMSRRGHLFCNTESLIMETAGCIGTLVRHCSGTTNCPEGGSCGQLYLLCSGPREAVSDEPRRSDCDPEECTCSARCFQRYQARFKNILIGCTGNL